MPCANDGLPVDPDGSGKSVKLYPSLYSRVTRQTLQKYPDLFIASRRSVVVPRREQGTWVRQMFNVVKEGGKEGNVDVSEENVEPDDQDQNGKGFVGRNMFHVYAAHAWISCDVTDIKEGPVEVKKKKEEEVDDDDDVARARHRVGQLEYTIRMEGANVPSTKTRPHFFEGLLIPPNTAPASKVCRDG